MGIFPSIYTKIKNCIFFSPRALRLRDFMRNFAVSIHSNQKLNLSLKQMTKSIFKLLILSCIMLGCTNKDTSKSQEIDHNKLYRDLVHNIHPANHGASENYILLVDYSIPSNESRFFIWDLNQDKIIDSFWCAHGFGGGSTNSAPVFSNVEGSNCSSLGLYLIDRRYGTSPRWGYQYHAVDGLSSTNSNARVRQILIHPWRSVTADWQKQIGHPMACDGRSAGCFTTTDVGYETIHKLIRSESKRILLYAFNGVPSSCSK